MDFGGVDKWSRLILAVDFKGKRVLINGGRPFDTISINRNHSGTELEVWSLESGGGRKGAQSTDYRIQKFVNYLNYQPGNLRNLLLKYGV